MGKRRGRVLASMMPDTSRIDRGARMLTALWLVSSIAGATEIGTTRKIGLGATGAWSGITATGKLWLGEKAGIAGFASTAIVYHSLRAQFDLDLIEFHDWKFGRLDGYAWAGLEVGGHTVGWTTKPTFGPVLGVGADMKFHTVPVEAFVAGGAGYYPLCSSGTPGMAWCSLQPRMDVGGRYYF
jgi:hypothetical protein